jgi:multidrug efflux pump subunit AcrA (membrane-fusion protein)
MNVAARVLGPMPRSQAQSAGWLLTVERAPQGLGPGTRAPVELHGATTVAGLLVPAAALLYAEQGAYVYRQERAAGDTFHYQAVPVKPLARVGAAWLVAGLSRGDPIVVQGAGVLWSLQGISSFSAAEEEHD